MKILMVVDDLVGDSTKLLGIGRSPPEFAAFRRRSPDPWARGPVSAAPRGLLPCPSEEDRFQWSWPWSEGRPTRRRAALERERPSVSGGAGCVIGISGGFCTCSAHDASQMCIVYRLEIDPRTRGTVQIVNFMAIQIPNNKEAITSLLPRRSKQPLVPQNLGI